MADDPTALLRALVASLPRCSYCPRPATHAWTRGQARFCPGCAPSRCPPYPRCAPLQAAVAFLAGAPVAAATTERDRLRSALQTIADGRHERPIGLPWSECYSWCRACVARAALAGPAPVAAKEASR